MSDFSQPNLSTAYASFLSALSARINDVAVGFSPTYATPTNQPTGSIRWNPSNNYWEIWNGTTWGALTVTYAISISGNAATATTASAVPWSGITSKPTTVAGYAISDALTTTAAASTYAPLVSPALTGTPTTTDGTTAYEVGYKDVPQNSKTTGYTLALSDRGKHVLMNGSSLTLTVPANASVAFPVGTAITVVNTNATSLSIAITTDTMTKAGSTTTGTRTLAQNGVATLLKVGTTSWLISGSGLT